MSETENTTDYESFTVAELKDELSARDLPTSGNKDELIKRLEDDDVEEAEEAEEEETEEEPEELGRTEEEAREAAETSTDIEVREGEAPVDDPYKTTYSPYQLPADPVAAQAFIDAHPDDVDTSGPMPDPNEEEAIAAIEERRQAHAEMGTPVPDPRVPGGDEPPPDPSLSALFPTEVEVGPPENTVLTATGENFLITTLIGFGVFSDEEAEAGLGEAGDPKWEQNTTFVDANTLTTVITQGLFPGADNAVPVVVGEPGGTVSDAINFAFVEPTPPAPPDEGEGEEGES